VPGSCQTPFWQVRHYARAMRASQEGGNGHAVRRLRDMPGGPKGVIRRAFYRRMVHDTGKGTLQLLAAQTQDRAEA